MEYIMGIDLGTTGCKATVFDREGKLRAQSYREYPVESYTGMIDPEMVWDHTCQVIRECTREYDCIEAVCVTSFGESVVILDQEGKVLCESALYTSGSATEEWKELEENIGRDRICQITGHISHPMYTVNRLYWYRKHCPQTYEKTKEFLFFSGFAAARLGGKSAIEDTQAARSLAYDVKNRKWSGSILCAAGIDPGKLPQVVSAGETLGKVSTKMQGQLGFRNRPLIIAGGQDQPCVALGMGAIAGGDAVYGLGTVECLSVVLDQYQQSEAMKAGHLICGPHVVPGKFLTYGVLYSGGNIIKELRNRLYGQERAGGQKQNVYELMFQEMQEAETTPTFIPHLYGTGTPSMNQEASGCICGLRVETTRGGIVKAAVEGLAFDMRENIENMRKAGIPVTSIKAAGGGAKSMAAMQVRADAMQEKIAIPKDVQAGTRGTFFIAAMALGWMKEYSDIRAYENPGEMEVLPQEKEKSNCERKYGRYLKLWHLLEAEQLL